MPAFFLHRRVHYNFTPRRANTSLPLTHPSLLLPCIVMPLVSCILYVHCRHMQRQFGKTYFYISKFSKKKGIGISTVIKILKEMDCKYRCIISLKFTHGANGYLLICSLKLFSFFSVSLVKKSCSRLWKIIWFLSQDFCWDLTPHQDLGFFVL